MIQISYINVKTGKYVPRSAKPRGIGDF